MLLKITVEQIKIWTERVLKYQRIPKCGVVQIVYSGFVFMFLHVM